jgi:hypothetical protein
MTPQATAPTIATADQIAIDRVFGFTASPPYRAPDAAVLPEVTVS